MRSKLFAMMLSLSLGASAYAQEAPKADPVESKPKRRITYTPPDRGAPVTRTGGGTRGQGLSQVSIELLSPQQTGLTTMESPTVLYYLSAPTDKPIIFTVTDTKSRETILEHAEKGSKTAGIHALDLSKHNVKLQLGRDYKLVAVVEEVANDDSQNATSSGRIKRVDFGNAPTPKTPDAATAAAMYAERGYWYDAQAKLHEAIAAGPNDKELRASRAELLAQEGLKGAAEFERK